MIDYLACVPIVLLLVIGTLLLALHRALPVAISAWAAVVALGLSLASSVPLLWPLQTGPLTVVVYQWSPVEGMSVNLGVRVDSLSYLLALLILTISLAVMLFLATSRHRLEQRSSDDGAGGRGEPESDLGTPNVSAEAPVSRAPGRDSIGSIPQTPMYAWILNLVALVLALVYAGNLLVVYLAWTAIGLCLFATKVAETDTEEARRSAYRFLTVDLFTSYFVLAGAVLAQHDTGTLLLLPSAKSESGLTLALALISIAALARTLQYPFSRLFLLVEHAQPSLSALVQCLVCAISGSYLLLRVVAAAGSGMNPLGIALVVLGLATAAYGLAVVRKESALPGLVSRATVVELGVVIAAFGVGTYAAVATGIVLIVSHVLIRVSLGIALEADAGRIAVPGVRRDAIDNNPAAPSAPAARNLVVALGIASLAGLPPFGGFWGRWMLAGVALAQGNLLLLALPVVSLMVLAWHLFNALDRVLALSEARSTGGTNSSLSLFSAVLVPIGLLGMSTVLPGALLTLLVQPATRAALASDESLVSLALTAGNNPIDGWAAVCTLGIFLVASWAIYRLGLMPLIIEGRLKINRVHTVRLDRVIGSDWPALSARLLSPRPTVITLLAEPERLGQRTLDAAIALGRVFGDVFEEVEERHFAPAVLLAVVMVVFVLTG